jgi:hypothetical protein
MCLERWGEEESIGDSLAHEEQMEALSGQIETLNNQLDNMGGPNGCRRQPTPHFVDEDGMVIFSRVRSQRRKAWIEAGSPQ